MQDEHFIRDWTEVHEEFTADALIRFGAGRQVCGSTPCPIGPAYEGPVEAERPSALSPAAQASLRGLAATVLTVTLWVVVMTLAMPAPVLAASQDGVVQLCDCVAYLPLA
jgi:hypothetical protein